MHLQGEQGNITADANYDLIKQMCNLLDTVELLRAAESASTDHQTVIEVSKALKSTMNNWVSMFFMEWCMHIQISIRTCSFIGRYQNSQVMI